MLNNVINNLLVLKDKQYKCLFATKKVYQYLANPEDKIHLIELYIVFKQFGGRKIPTQTTKKVIERIKEMRGRLSDQQLSELKTQLTVEGKSSGKFQGKQINEEQLLPILEAV